MLSCLVLGWTYMKLELIKQQLGSGSNVRATSIEPNLAGAKGTQQEPAETLNIFLWHSEHSLLMPAVRKTELQ